MGKLIWHQWARLLALTAATYMTWASLWAFMYRKFFWDFVGGTLGPAGLLPNDTAKVFNKVIIDWPILQGFTLVLSLLTLALELPGPGVQGTWVHRSQIARIVMYLSAGMIGSLVYQTFDCAVYFAIAALAYGRSMYLKEVMGGDERKQEIGGA